MSKLMRFDWSTQKLASIHGESAWISPRGTICYSRSKYKEHIIEFLEEDGSTFQIRHSQDYAEGPVSAAWSPGGRFFVTGSGNHERAIRVFDLHRRRFLEIAGHHKDNLYWMNWSQDGRYLVTASSGYDPELKVWQVVKRNQHEDDSVSHWQNELFTADSFDEKPAIELAQNTSISRICNFPHKFGTDGLCSFERPIVSFSDELIAVFASLKDWTNTPGRLVVLSLSDLRELFQFEVQFRVESIAWSLDHRSMFLCSTEDDAYRFGPFDPNEASQPKAKRLDIGSIDTCLQNPVLPVCAFSGGRWARLPNHAQNGRIVLFDLNSESVISDFRCDQPVVHSVWSADGRKLYAVCNDGTRVVCHLQ